LCGSDFGEFLSSRDGTRRTTTADSEVDAHSVTGFLRAFPPRIKSNSTE
jgi:hypothetical protein